MFSPLPAWIGFVCICIPHLQGWVHELLRLLQGHEIKKKERKKKKSEKRLFEGRLHFHFWGAACRSRSALSNLKIVFVSSSYFEILAIQLERHWLSFFSSSCAYFHPSPLFRIRSSRKVRVVLTKICLLKHIFHLIVNSSRVPSFPISPAVISVCFVFFFT